MTKSLDYLSETVRDQKPSFSKLDLQPRKPRKHRYERRKIRAYLHGRDWEAEPN